MLIDTLFPTHAMLALSLAAAADQSPPPAGHPQPQLLHLAKYIILRDPAGQEHPLVFPCLLTHRHLVPPDLAPASAGFLSIVAGRLRIPAVGSSSLGLEPRPEDRHLLQSLLGLPTP